MGTLCVTSNDPVQPELDVPVTLNVIYNFSGFIGDIKNPPEFNAVRAPSVVPIIFSLAGDYGLDILADSHPMSQQIDCTTLEPIGGLETTTPPGSSALRYDAETDRYTYPWQTQRSWNNTCRQLVLEFDDGMTYVAYFDFRR
jgi:hypothetical protein